MDKNKIKNYAIWAREKLIEDIVYKASLIGITDKRIFEPLPQSTNDLMFFDIGTKKYIEVKGIEILQRKSLINAIQNKQKDGTSYKESFNYIVEEVAYTWFNRLVAIRFMEVNDYLPSGTRVLSSVNSDKIEPDMVTNPFDMDIEFSPYEKDIIYNYKEDNNLDELFRFLFIKQCNKLNEILPELFEKTNDYTELLLNISFIDKDGVVYKLTHDIDEDDFNVDKEGQVEIIGWMYQYYNSVPKDIVFAAAKKNKKISKENIPAATQLFTPDWIVRYMVENSLGKLWCEGHKCDEIKKNWKYYIEDSEQNVDTNNQSEDIKREYSNIDIDAIKIIDPCCGSGHILIYLFDVLMQIYESIGYSKRDAVLNIVTNNIYGVDIDKRACQLSYFAIMMKARQYDKRFFARHVRPNIYCVMESNDLDRYTLDEFINGDLELEKDISCLISELYNAKECGSLVNVTKKNWDKIFDRCNDIEKGISIYKNIVIEDLIPVLKFAYIISQKYDVVITNPPYMTLANVSQELSTYVNNRYPDSKSDLFAAFIEKCGCMINNCGYQAMITQHSWMFLSSYEKLRKKTIQNKHIVNMVHLGTHAFEDVGGEVVQTTSFVLKNCKNDSRSVFIRLVDSKHKEKDFFNEDLKYYFNQVNFEKIPGSPIAYWASDHFINAYKKGTILDKIADVKIGMGTGKNEIFVRKWFEINYEDIDFSLNDISQLDGSEKKFFPYNKGGEYRLWFGNIQDVLWFNKEGRELMGSQSGHRENGAYNWYCHAGLTWSFVSSSRFGIRYMPTGCFFDVAGSTLFANDNNNYILGFLSSKICFTILQMLNPTLNFQAGNIKSLPVIFDKIEDVNFIVCNNITSAKMDWDSFEISWGFKTNPLISKMNMLWDATAVGATMHSYYGQNPPIPKSDLELAYLLWKGECEERFQRLKANEEELNRIFIDIYGLQNELFPDVEEKDVTVYRVFDSKKDIPENMGSSRYSLTKHDVIINFISYAVGCMFGRYSLDVEGLAYAGGDWDSFKYRTYVPDGDNCIPITDEEYFEDDIVGRFVNFVKAIYGEEGLEDNLLFIADALGNKGNTSREVIRNYFLNDFIKDHNKMYQKRPIYWMFDSGKGNGFKALVYMHRWNADTIGHVRTEYLHRIQRTYEKEIDRMTDTIENGFDNKEITVAMKRKEKLIKQLKETKDYDEKIAHLALRRIDIDLDDGVKVNYDKVQTDEDGELLKVLAKI